MSATSEILKPQRVVGDFPAALRSAAYISSGGRAYRLFSEDEKNALSAEPFQLDRVQFDRGQFDKGTLAMFPPKNEDGQAAQVPLPSPLTEQLTEGFDSLCVLGGDPQSALKLFEAFSEHSPSRLRKQFVSDTVPAAVEKTEKVEKTETEDETPMVLPLPPSSRNFSVVSAENEASSAEEASSNETEVSRETSSAAKMIIPLPVRFPAYLELLEQRAQEQVQILASTLEEQYRQGRKTLSFNSIRLGDGCTTLCLCAARELAKRGYHVLLADAHKQHPELPELLGLTVDPNLYEIFTLIPNRLELLPWSETFLEFDEQNNGSARSFTDVITALRKDYDIILLDNGCLTESTLADPVAQWKAMHADSVLLVLNTRHPAPFDVKSVVRKIMLQEVEFIGIAENYV